MPTIFGRLSYPIRPRIVAIIRFALLTKTSKVTTHFKQSEQFRQDNEANPLRAQTVSFIQLKALLTSIKDGNNPVHVRFRVLGGMWQRDFMEVIDVDDDRIIFKSENGGKLIILNDMKMIVQFELYHSLAAYQPNYHYTVVPD